MPPQPMEVYFIATQLNLSGDKRYCLVLDAPAGALVNILHFSAQMDMYRAALDFKISAGHPDFAATGLKRDSYIMPRIIAEPITKFVPGTYRGQLTGHLLEEFRKWFGD